MATRGFEKFTEADAARMGRKVAPVSAMRPSGRRTADEPANERPEPSKPQKGSKSKYLAIACIVTPDLTLFTSEDIRTADEASAAPLRGTGTLIEQAARGGIYGQWFGSLKEGRRYIELIKLQASGEIGSLELQPKLLLIVKGLVIGYYIADFRYMERVSRDGEDWREQVVEDTKGMKTPVYLLKKKLVEAIYGITIRET